MHFLYSIYYELTASTCFEHYLLIFRRRCTNNNWYFVCMLCLLAATTIGMERHAHKIPIVVCAAPPENEQVVVETCRGR
jgi:hypothetical protein